MYMDYLRKSLKNTIEATKNLRYLGKSTPAGILLINTKSLLC